MFARSIASFKWSFPCVMQKSIFFWKLNSSPIAIEEPIILETKEF